METPESTSSSLPSHSSLVIRFKVHIVVNVAVEVVVVKITINPNFALLFVWLS